MKTQTIIVVGIAAFAGWYFFLRKNKRASSHQTLISRLEEGPEGNPGGTWVKATMKHYGGA